MRVLVLTAEARVPDLSAVYQSLARYLDIDLHVLAKPQQRQLGQMYIQPPRLRF